MNLLAFDTSTDSLSIAVARTVSGQPRQWLHTGAGGAQASAGLIGALLALLRDAGLAMAQLDAICFGSGPGSFTGLRTACAVAQGLAFGAKVPVLPIESLLALAEEARLSAVDASFKGEIVALLDARMDEMYAATYAFDGERWSTVQGSHLLRPQALRVMVPGHILAGNVFTTYADRLAHLSTDLRRITALPTASAMLRLAPQLLAQGKAVPAALALPLYIRDKVAKTTLERAIEKAQALNASTARQDCLTSELP